MTEVESEAVRQNRRSLVILFTLGFMPLIIAWVVFFYFPELMPSGTTNEGDLIEPPVVAANTGLDGAIGKWTLLIPVVSDCDTACEERFYLSRQVNVALGKESERVQRALINVGGNPAKIQALLDEYPNLIRLDLTETQFSKLPAGAEAIYLMDPVGNIFMSYTGEKAGKPMLKDIKHLLKISNIG